jgi:hypothetical protein
MKKCIIFYHYLLINLPSSSSELPSFFLKLSKVFILDDTIDLNSFVRFGIIEGGFSGCLT